MGVFIKHTRARLSSGPFPFGIAIEYDYTTGGRKLPEHKMVVYAPGQLAMAAWERSESGSHLHLSKTLRRLQKRKPKEYAIRQDRVSEGL
jgi:hypothetical protein